MYYNCEKDTKFKGKTVTDSSAVNLSLKKLNENWFEFLISSPKRQPLTLG